MEQSFETRAQAPRLLATVGLVCVGIACAASPHRTSDSGAGELPATAAHLVATAGGSPSEAAPYGVPPSFSWVSGAEARPTRMPGPEYTHANYWGAIFRGATNTTPPNTVIQVRNCSLWLLYADEPEWTHIGPHYQLGGATFTPSYGDASAVQPRSLAQAATGADVVPADGYIWHFWPADSYQPVRGEAAKEVLVNCQARFTLADAAQVDDRGSADYLIHVGADWRNPSDPSCANDNFICKSFGVGRLERLGASWRNHTFHSLTAAEIAAGAVLPPEAVFALPAE